MKHTSLVIPVSIGAIVACGTAWAAEPTGAATAYINGLIAALVGAIAGGLFTYVLSSRAERWKNTMQLYGELNSPVLIDSRTKAWRLIEKNPAKAFSDIAADVSSDTESAHLWTVASFYQRLSILLQHGQLAEKVVPSLFGELFVWWYIVSFGDQSKVGDWGGMRTRFDFLLDFLRAHVDKNVFTTWEETARFEAKDVLLAREVSAKR